MSRKLTRVERLNRALHAHDRPSGYLNPSTPLGSWQPPGPHAGGIVGFGGGNVHTDRIVRSDNRSTQQVIADMIQGK
jgi:hypothetical protein